jgi:hypothetical protein
MSELWREECQVQEPAILEVMNTQAATHGKLWCGMLTIEYHLDDVVY